MRKSDAGHIAIVALAALADTSAVVERDQLRDAGGALTTVDFEGQATVDPQTIGRDVLDFCDADGPPMRSG